MGKMSEEKRMHVFETPAPAKLRIEIPNGRIRLAASDTAQTRIELSAANGDDAAREWIADAEIGVVGDEIVVRGRQPRPFQFRFGRIEAVIEAPADSAAQLSTGSGEIETTGRLGRLTATTGSGDVTVGECGEGRARTGSGDIRIDRASGAFDAKSGSGDIKLGDVDGDVRAATGNGDARIGAVKGAVNVTTGSGDIAVEEAGGSVEVFTASGDIQVRKVAEGRVRARTVSGDVVIGVEKGVAALLDVRTLTGEISSELQGGEPAGPDDRKVELQLSTVSGDVRLTRV
jgi:DUF4097 and DUF4098 domain-containing protein YvlB